MNDTQTIRQQIGDRAAWIAGRLADANQFLGRPRPPTTTVGNWKLLALDLDDDARHSADRARAEATSVATPGRGFDHWHAHPDLIKFVAIEPLAAAWRATGDESYARACRFLFEDFFASLKPPKWAGGGMRLSQRIGRWAHYLPYFFDSQAFDDAFVRRVFDHIPAQLASILATHKVTTRGNIRLLETEGLFWVGLALPMLDGTAEALARARWVYADTARRGVHEDGSYCEYDPNYHDVFQAMFHHVLLWRQAFPELDLPDVRKAGAQVFDYAVVSKSPIGHSCGIQESPSPWIAKRDCAAILAKRADVRRLAGLDDRPPPLVAHCQDANQVFLRTGWERTAMFAAFDASMWGGAHSHLARNGVLLFAHGRALLADTGSLTYAMDQKAHEGDALDHQIGPYGKSTRAHNTLNLNGWNQAPTNVDWLRVFAGDRLAAVASQYSGGYWPGSYGWYFRDGFGAGIHAEHQRLLFWIPGRFIVVVDRMMRWNETTHGHAEQRQPSLEMNWQLSPGGQVSLDADHAGFTAIYPEGGLRGHFAKLAAGMTLALHEGETDPPRGWITTRTKARGDLRRAGVFDTPLGHPWRDRTYMPAPQVAAVATPMQGFAETMVSVFLPFDGDAAPQVTSELSGPVAAANPPSLAGGLTLHWPDGARDALAWSEALAAPLFRVALPDGEVETDACLLHQRYDANGTPTARETLDGTYCQNLENNHQDSSDESDQSDQSDQSKRNP